MMNPKAVDEQMGKEGFGKREFLLWVLRSQALVVVGVGADDVDRVPDIVAAAVGCDGEGTGFGEAGDEVNCWSWPLTLDY